MAEKNGRLETRWHILEAINRPVDKMTVEGICERARISKPTFYRCFTSKYDVIPWWISWCDDRSLALIGSEYSWQKGLLLAGDLYAPIADRIAFVEDRGSGFHTCEQRAEVRHLEESLSRAIRMHTGQVSEAMAFCIRSFSFLQNEILLALCRQGSFSSEAFAEMALAVVPRKLHDALAMPAESSNRRGIAFDPICFIPFASCRTEDNPPFEQVAEMRS